MEVQFDGHYFLSVVLFLMIMCCNRNFLSCLQELLPCCSRFVHHCCDGWICCEVEYCARDFFRTSFTMFCFLQPLILCLIHMANGQRSDVNTASSIIFCDLHLNQTDITYKNTNTSSSAVIPYHLDLGKSVCTEVDYILLILPFAAAVSFSNFLLTYHISDGVIHQGTVWDNSLDPAMFSYELGYYLEVWCMNFALLAVQVEETSFQTLYYKTHALTLLMILFISMARYNQESISDQWMAILLFGLLFLILIPMMGKSLQQHCVLTQIMTVFHGLVVIVICFGHYMALGQQGAGYILTLRSLVSAFVCVVHIIVIYLGRNRVCS